MNLLNPYVIVITVALLTATLVSIFNKYAEPGEKNVGRNFLKIFVAALVSGVAFVFIANRPDDVLTEPFLEGGLADF
ncbi:hypothetical protein PBCVAN69C_626L [Paramecium bursaria Chlorella virus AN69C]|uniref:Uncharacterized protein n=2 Tax=Chlorovirus TaxID=181083 RepID=Q98541_PBCV1|nr:hypothetical protein PBCV1_A491R [Paramecium bursaria Chlorella virus 1]AGE48583.1 hypothetical protein PBCVAN69C_626L [Paramecium bursaria Chlorella virus AN69C]AGE51597.1 hypothetical protein PBCVCviKI_535R [Paramecium bursaria Chlorella virus CviKI]AGE52614.1 hypothetical protein PBCVCvsA1_552R [Paramecium bursaria Chlorella virus CvsA1]AGE53967.1 hypothetical protein PBCVIL3A_547R [Paramecium bursaria Chlorella virus IL3A]AGE54659.1 hypothetical protein PBCVKS1B_473R [Paramecium bursari